MHNCDAVNHRTNRRIVVIVIVIVLSVVVALSLMGQLGKWASGVTRARPL